MSITKEKYNRNRPFLVINVITRPSKNPKTGENVRTEDKGWMEVNGNLTSYEQPSLVDRVNAIHLRTANVIIDVLNGKIIKNSFGDTPDDEVVHHYMEKYRSQVTEAMDIWLSQKAAAKAASMVSDGTYSVA